MQIALAILRFYNAEKEQKNETNCIRYFLTEPKVPNFDIIHYLRQPYLLRQEN